MTDERYGDYADEYYNKGWQGVVPVPYGKKNNPPYGYSGHDGIMPSYPDVMAWIETDSEIHGYKSNLGLRLPENVIGIDVDAYGDKSGERCLREAERRWGALPPTVRTTSRTDRVSGIRLYKVPSGLKWRNGIVFPEMNLGGIDTVQSHHRYAVSFPSIHPEGRQYLWLNDSCERVEIPHIDDLPDLPQSWINALSITADEITTRVNPFEQMKSMPKGRMTDKVSKAFKDAIGALTGPPGSRHDAILGKILWLVRLGTEQQQTGVHQALEQLEDLFVKKTADRNSETEARQEFRRMVYGENGHNLIASTPSAEGERILLGMSTPETDSKPPQVNSAGSTGDPETRAKVESDDDMDRAIEVLEQQFGPTLTTEDSWLFGDGPGELPDPEPVPDALPEAPVVQKNRDELPFYDQLYRVGDLASIQPAEPLVDKLLYRNTLAQIAGDPGSYKTFFTLGLACAVAGPKEKWGTYDIKHHGAVIYVAAEGLSGMRARTLAWCQQQNVDPDKLNMYFFPHAFQLDNWDDMQQVFDMVDKTQAVLIVLDTRARVTLGLDENSAEHQGKAIEAAEQIRQRYGTTVLVVHHSARSGKAGRGSNTWDGALWSELRSGKDNGEDMTMKVHCEKHKDAVSGCDHAFQMLKVVVDQEKMPGVEKVHRTTLVAVERQQGEPDLNGGATSAETGTAAETIADILKTAPTGGLSRSELKSLAFERGVSKDAFNKALWRKVKDGKVFEWKVGTTLRYGDEDTMK